MKPISKFTIAIDKLEIMTEHISLANNINNLTSLNRVTAKPYYNCSNTTLLKLTDNENTDKNYHLAYTIRYQNIIIGALLTDRTKFYLREKSLVKIRLDNQLLYSDKWSVYLQAVLNDLNLVLHNVTYLELALDTNSEARELFYYYFDNERDYHFVGGKRLVDNVSSFTKEYRNGEFNKTVYLGKTDKKLSIYNKSLEIKEKSKKYYITDFHEKNGLDITQDIERIEVKLKNTALKRYQTKYEYQPNPSESISEYAYSKLTKVGKDAYYLLPTGSIVDIHKKPVSLEYYNSLSNKGQQNYKKVTLKTETPITIELLSDTNYLLALFKENFIIDFREKTDNSNINRCKPITFIEFPDTLSIIKLSTMTLTPTKNDIKLKQLIKMNLKQFALTNIILFKDSALAAAKQYNLLDYFDKTLAEVAPIKEASKEINDNFSFSL